VDNVYYEARGETFTGQQMVAKVVLNRTKHPDYPDTICGVVYQPFQFSWTANKQPKPNPITYAKAKEAAYLAHQHPTTAIFFHNHKIKPHWSKTRTVVAKEGNHVFYN
jgi:spore germination cell wall hydrolase CwlJ-like protein